MKFILFLFFTLVSMVVFLKVTVQTGKAILGMISTGFSTLASLPAYSKSIIPEQLIF